MEMPNFENRAERGEEALKEHLKEIAVELKAEGIEVDDECRVNMDSYKAEPKYAGGIAKDKIDIAKMQTDWKKRKQQAKREIIKGKKQEKETRSGEKMEMFKTALFHKALGAKFYILRSSLHDDYKNGIDNVIADKESGAVVDAFDEVVSHDGELDKGSKTRTINGTTGGFLKYGIGIKNGEPIKQENPRVPLFYLALTHKELESAISDFEIDREELSELEKALLKKLTDSISEQTKIIAGIQLLKNKIPDIEKFQNALQEATNPEKN